jgi:hypothetical protein
LPATPIFTVEKGANQVQNNDVDNIICLISEVITEYIKEGKNPKGGSNEKS